MKSEAEEEADREYDQNLHHWHFKAERLVPRDGKVTQVGPQGFWFLRAEKAAAEFMAWPVSDVTVDSPYGRVAE